MQKVKVKSFISLIKEQYTRGRFAEETKIVSPTNTGRYLLNITVTITNLENIDIKKESWKFAKIFS